MISAADKDNSVESLSESGTKTRYDGKCLKLNAEYGTCMTSSRTRFWNETFISITCHIQLTLPFIPFIRLGAQNPGTAVMWQWKRHLE